MATVTASTWVAIASAAIGTATAAAQHVQGKKAAEKQEKAADVEKATAGVENARKRRQLLNRRRIKAAEMKQGAAVSGMQGSSLSVGAQGAVASNTASSIASQGNRIAGAFGAHDLRQSAQKDLNRGQTISNFGKGLQGGVNTFGQDAIESFQSPDSPDSPDYELPLFGQAR